MVIRALDRKLIRDLGQMRGQVITIALVVACGIAAYAGMQSTWGSLQRSRDTYYERYRFADVFAHAKRAPRGLEPRIEAIEGVATAHTRIVEYALVPMDDMIEPATSQIVSLPDHGDPPLGDVFLRSGRLPITGRTDEALLLESFAQEHDLEVGDRIDAVLNGRLRELRIVGLALSPEFVFPMAPGDFTSDPKRFAVLWMRESVVAPAFDMEGAFNDVLLRLQPGASLAEVRTQLDLLLEPFGGLGAVGRDKQVSNFMLEGEMSQLESFATVVPLIFLAVAAFLLNVVLSRVIHLQRPQIASLKAVGYSDLEIGLHYLKLVSIVVLLGAVLGLAVGGWLGQAMTNLYAGFFRFPVIEFRLGARVAAIGIFVSLVSAVIGAFGAVRAVVRLPPAEAMRAPAPARYRRGLLDYAGLHVVFGESVRMILREIRRRPFRLVLSSLGIAMAVGILVVGRFSQDAVEYLLYVQFHRAMQEDLSVGFREPVSSRALRDLEHVPGVLHVEGLRVVPVRFHAGHRWRDSSITGYPEGMTLRHVLDENANEVALSRHGVVITRKLAEVLGVGVGDVLDAEIREGNRGRRQVRIAGLVDEPFGLQGHMQIGALHQLMREGDVISTALLSIDPAQYEDVHRRLEDMPGVGSVNRRNAVTEQFEEQSGEMMLVTTLIMTIFASTIAVGVVYNNARVALSTRNRDLASLRVLGFSRREISAMLLGELAIQVLLAIPIGLVIGTWMAEGVMSGTDPETYRFPVIISTGTYAFAALVALGSGVASALLVRRQLDRLDLIGVLKTRE